MEGKGNKAEEQASTKKKQPRHEQEARVSGWLGGVSAFFPPFVPSSDASLCSLHGGEEGAGRSLGRPLLAPFPPAQSPTPTALGIGNENKSDTKKDRPFLVGKEESEKEIMGYTEFPPFSVPGLGRWSEPSPRFFSYWYMSRVSAREP